LSPLKNTRDFNKFEFDQFQYQLEDFVSTTILMGKQMKDVQMNKNLFQLIM
jgi:hypothetical protein